MTMRAILCLLLAAAPATAAGAPAALVTDVSGEISPGVEPFQEIDSGTELSLRPGARLTIEHYLSCEAVTMTSGSVVVHSAGLDLDRAAVAGQAEMPCAQPITLAPEDMATAGVLVRGAGPPKIPLSPNIVIAGGGAGFDRMDLERDGQLLWTLPVRSGRVEWPEGRLFLTDQGVYSLVLVGPAGERRANVIADRGAGGRIVLRP